MDKKVYLVKILNKLEPVWDLARWLKVLVERWNFDDSMLDNLINSIKWAIKVCKSNIETKKLHKWLIAMERMRELEETSRIQDESDLLELDNILNDI